MSYRRMVPIDYDATDLKISACDTCTRWWAEVIDDADGALVREWHESECPVADDVAPPSTPEDELTDSPADRHQLNRAVGVVVALLHVHPDAALSLLHQAGLEHGEPTESVARRLLLAAHEHDSTSASSLDDEDDIAG